MVKNDDQEREGEESTEKAFKDEYVPSWQKQITLRAMVTGLILSVVFNFIVCKLNLTTGVIPSFNVAAGLLGFAGIKSWTSLIQKIGKLKQPFTRQENTVIQTCVVASSGIAFSSGTASYMLGMSPYVASQAEAGNTPNNTKKLSISWMLPYLFVVSFAGLFSIVALRKMMIMKYKLTYPSGTATAYLINCFHTPKGAKLAKKQVSSLFKTFGLSFIFGAVQWIVAGGEGCGFGHLPTFGREAYRKKFYFDFNVTYVGVGMLCPYMVNISLLIGAIVSWGIMWPMIEEKKGDWYSAKLSPSSLHGIQGYRVFIAIAMMLGDGLFHFAYMLVVTISSFTKRRPQGDYSGEDDDDDKKIRNEYFLKDEIPNWAAIGGYTGIAVISIIVVPIIFHSLKWYHILVAYLIAPILAFCNSYGAGLTDWSLASNYGKIAILTFSYWVGLKNGGVIAGLASCGLMMSILDTAANLMGDFKTGYLTLTSPRSMFFSQLIGTAMGCVITPLVFWVFNSAYKLGDPKGSYPAPYGLMYRGIALLGVEGFGSLPRHCLRLAVWFFVAAILINLMTQLLKKFETKYGIYRFIPSPMCMAIPFYLGGYFAIDMCLGSLILFIWQKLNKKKAKDFGPAVASGLICGESLWGIPASVLALAGVKAPFCMKA
ncbi:putative metal-nicotianamine transporter YSL7 [Capsicum chacoense]|uniref:Metal-nicotianamine transporter YSL7 n=1 Tax=Capsicum annuum TaxID=4072 RepID=A0A1U8FND7_CAPAN|nr:probable metal-nicotianamine transporter YSL7 [Capsicum annuum]KAF3644588.1 putative metal-nicotianamine transporter YSL7 [Capsicum annuum]KAF3683853.1 putative metal-nicotianamine transporter YSL7 [Capsicum annuum]PHT89179.1 putative metal-nicotianamine transporter YSL7 [Capsicum annuum]